MRHELGGQGAGQVWLCHDLDYLRAIEAQYGELLARDAGRTPDPQAVQRMPGIGRTGSIAVVPVFGAIVQHPSLLTYYGLATSTEQLRAEIAAAQADPQIAGVLLRINSGGGSVNGVPSLAAFMRKIRGSFPVWGHADSYALSAAQWILASCGNAYASPLGCVGSIGVVYEHMSVAGQDEKEGRKRTLIRMPSRKQEAWDGADLSPEARAHIEHLATLAYNAFVADVAKGRGVSVETVRSGVWGEGAIVDAAAASRAGMLDGVMSFDETLAVFARLLREGNATSGAKAKGAQSPVREVAAALAGVDPALVRLRQGLF
jgi:ClpP class serine protease